jgi:hypothetical protein
LQFLGRGVGCCIGQHFDLVWGRGHSCTLHGRGSRTLEPVDYFNRFLLDDLHRFGSFRANWSGYFHLLLSSTDGQSRTNDLPLVWTRMRGNNHRSRHRPLRPLSGAKARELLPLSTEIARQPLRRVGWQALEEATGALDYLDFAAGRPLHDVARHPPYAIR